MCLSVPTEHNVQMQPHRSRGVFIISAAYWHLNVLSLNCWRAWWRWRTESKSWGLALSAAIMLMSLLECWRESGFVGTPVLITVQGVSGRLETSIYKTQSGFWLLTVGVSLIPRIQRQPVPLEGIVQVKNDVAYNKFIITRHHCWWGMDSLQLKKIFICH